MWAIICYVINVLLLFRVINMLKAEEMSDNEQGSRDDEKGR